MSKTTDSTVIFGPAQLLFGLPPHIRVVDDLTLGLRSGAEAIGLRARIVHPVELLDRAYSNARVPTPS